MTSWFAGPRYTVAGAAAATAVCLMLSTPAHGYYSSAYFAWEFNAHYYTAYVYDHGPVTLKSITYLGESGIHQLDMPVGMIDRSPTYHGYDPTTDGISTRELDVALSIDWIPKDTGPIEYLYGWGPDSHYDYIQILDFTTIDLGIERKWAYSEGTGGTDRFYSAFVGLLSADEPTGDELTANGNQAGPGGSTDYGLSGARFDAIQFSRPVGFGEGNWWGNDGWGAQAARPTGVPEPTTGFILGISLTIAGLLRRRRAPNC